jgi:hypothetical protein
MKTEKKNAGKFGFGLSRKTSAIFYHPLEIKSLGAFHLMYIHSNLQKRNLLSKN